MHGTQFIYARLYFQYIQSTVHTVCRCDYDAILKFSQEKLLKLNTKKTVSMVFGNTKTEKLKLQIEDGNGGEIESVEEFKLLGVVLDRKLTMKTHIRHIKKKCYRRIRVMRNLVRNNVPTDKCVTVYKTQIRSIIEYAAPVYWPMINATDTAELERIQRNSLKTIFGFEFS